MNTEEFKAYQKQLNVQREQFLDDRKKLSPKVLLGDDDFDVSVGDIPINLQKPITTPIQKPKPIKSKSNPLF